MHETPGGPPEIREVVDEIEPEEHGDAWLPEDQISSDPDDPPRGDPRFNGASGGHADDRDDCIVDLDEWDAGEDTGKIPPRGWLLGNQFCRGFLSSLIGAGSAGKTSLRIAQALSLTTGSELTKQHVFKRSKVLIVSFEDGKDELRRRVRAAMLHHGIKHTDVAGWLFCAALKGLKLAEMRNGTAVAGNLAQSLRRVVERWAIDLLILDPFVKTHGVEENSNSAIDFVATILAGLATELNIAIDAPHHLRKGSTNSGEADASRGGSAFVDAGRLVYSLVPMTPEEAKAFGLGDRERRSMVRLDNAKINLAPPGDKAVWFQLIGVVLGNHTEDYPNGDEVQTVEPWDPPDIWKAMSPAATNDVLNKIDAGLPNSQRYSAIPQVKDVRAAWRGVKEVMPKLTEEQCRKIIATWLKNGVLEERGYHDTVLRKEKLGLFVNAAKRPG